ncbi:MAG: hypothetical protein PVH52_02155 [bacterium]|jgi:hypothetical protein
MWSGLIKRAAILLSTAGLVWGLTLPAAGQLNKVEAENVTLIYASRAQDYLIPHAVNSFNKALTFHSKLFDYTPSEKIVVYMTDFADFGSGAASAVPDNGLNICIAPFSYAYETRPANERMNWLMNHETLHVLAGDKSSGWDRFFRGLFRGKVNVDAADPLSMLYSYWTNPRWYAPRWYHEGMAVFMETWMAGGLGRALGPYDEMVFRTMIRDSANVYNMVGLESEGTAADFQVGAVSYLYGTRFFNYLALKYGPMKLVEWVGRTSGTRAYFASEFKRVYGMSAKQAWADWIAWEQHWQETNLASIHEHPVTPFRPLSTRALGSISQAYYDPARKKIFAAVLYPAETGHIAAIDLDSGEVEKICDIHGPALYYVTSLAYDPVAGILYFAEDNNSWRDLCSYNLETGVKTSLIENVRMGDLAFNPRDRSIWGVRHYNGISTIARVPVPYTDWDQVYSFPYGRDVFDLAISPDGTYLTCALTEISGTQHLIGISVDSLEAGNADYDVLCDFEVSSPANFVFTPDGKHLYGSSYYTGVSNIYHYDIEQDSMMVVTNCETGLFRPVPFSEDSLIAFKYTGAGFLPGFVSSRPAEYVSAIKYLGQEVVDTHPVLRDWVVKPVAMEGRDSTPARVTGYHPLRSMRLGSVYPVIQGYKDYGTAGLRFDVRDKLGMSNLKVTGAYSPASSLPDRERVHFGLKLNYWQWTISGTYNHADFYDLFGPTKTSRKGYSWGVAYKRTLLYRPPRTTDFNLYVSGFGDLETMPRYQNVPATYDRFISFGLGVTLKNLRGTLGAVDYERGWLLEINSRNNYVNGEVIPLLYAEFGLALGLPFDHSPIWFWGSAGNAFGEEDDSFSNFFFGGFGNNWVDHNSIKRYREHYAFPGLDLNGVGGTNYGKAMLEWVLPPLRFGSVGFTSAYLRWARLSLFTAGVATNVDDEPDRRALLDVGAQLDFRLVTFSLLKSTLSVGYANALEKHEKRSEEWMVSLKLL